MTRAAVQVVSRVSVQMSAIVLAVASMGAAQAADNGLQRYSPGVGGSDMTAPLVPGTYFQIPLVAYHAKKIKGGDGRQATSWTKDSGGALLPYRANASIDASTQVLLPRLTYLSTDKVLGANIGLTAMLPLVRREATFGLVVPTLAAAHPLNQGLQATAAGMSGRTTGLGDVEVSPIMHWELAENQTVVFAPTLVLPTGDYDAAQRLNPGFGNFVTFRPSVQYAYIGDGWDVGARAVLSFNTRNKDNGYYSGNMFNLDYQLMKFVSEDVRVGLQGYFVRQLSDDTQKLDGLSPTWAKEIIDGNKMRVNAAGPAVGWLPNGGEFLLEGKFLKEWGARNRTEGQAWWLTFSKPL
ncbi:MAG: transporter [Aquabacterium sp.]